MCTSKRVRTLRFISIDNLAKLRKHVGPEVSIQFSVKNEHRLPISAELASTKATQDETTRSLQQTEYTFELYLQLNAFIYKVEISQVSGIQCVQWLVMNDRFS